LPRIPRAKSIKETGREFVRGWLQPVVSGLARTGIHPNWLSVAGLTLTAVGAVFFLQGRFTIGSLWAIVGASLDAVDGAVARAQGRESSFGAYLDSTLDRVSDTLLFVGIAGYYFYRPVLAASSLSPGLNTRLLSHSPIDDWMRGMAALLALAGAYMVSYTRARAEGLGIEVNVGWFERPERLIVLLGTALFGAGILMDYALALLLIMSWLTAVQRFFHVRNSMGSTSPTTETRNRRSAR
jgi:CDP-diacylglycerol--glycerol-3-phosphate 3-phosphatidyltransferase